MRIACVLNIRIQAGIIKLFRGGINVRQRFNLTLDPGVMKRIDECAGKEGLSRSRFIESAVTSRLSALRKQEMDRLAAEAYEAMGETDVAEAEEGMDEWSELVLADPFDWAPEESDDE